MKVIISGSRTVTDDVDYVDMSVAESGFDVTEVVSGCAKGADTLAIKWAEKYNIPIQPFEANWSDLSNPDALIKVNGWGQKYDAKAGLRRNELMAVYGEALIAIWDGKSKGTKHMIKMAKKRELPIFIYRTDIPRLTGHVQYETRDSFYRRIIQQTNTLPADYNQAINEQIEAARTPKGGWTRKQLAEWGVAWPPPKGWRKKLTQR